MAEQQGANFQMPDPAKLSQSMADIAERSQRIVTEFLTKQAAEGSIGMSDPLNIGSAFLEMTTKMMTDPGKLAQASMSLWQDYLNLWQNTASRMLGAETEPVIVPEREDRRFKDEAWSENEVFNFMKQSYLLTARWMQSTVNNVDGLDEKTAQKVDFYTRQFIDAFSPTNFVMTNPEVLRTTIETGGENLLNGLKNMLGDLERGKGSLRVSMTDMDAFTIGENIATTKGKVIFQNDLMQLIQYTPTTDKVLKRPLLFVPAWINKFYIMDLREKNSLVKWAVDQGHTCFMISWVNPDERLANKSFADYVIEGTTVAIDVIEKATGVPEVNAIGYCIGGTLLASTLAYCAAKGDDRIKSATFLTTMMDFSEPGELGVFIDEETICFLEKKMSERGYLEGSEMAGTFNMLRANDLIWSFVVSNYLLGKDPFPFDLLFWNSDSTRMPAVMHSFYLRNFYQKNRLKDPGGIVLGDVPIDLGKIKTPTYFLSAREDHIAPWLSTYKGTQLLGGPNRFVLAASGHIAGVINPPAGNKYCYWVNDRKPPKDPDAWLEKSVEKEGSWWPDWDAWMRKLSGKDMVAAREEGCGVYKPIEPAPGSYVKERL